MGSLVNADRHQRSLVPDAIQRKTVGEASLAEQIDEGTEIPVGIRTGVGQDVSHDWILMECVTQDIQRFFLLRLCAQLNFHAGSVT